MPSHLVTMVSTTDKPTRFLNLPPHWKECPFPKVPINSEGDKLKANVTQVRGPNQYFNILDTHFPPTAVSAQQQFRLYYILICTVFFIHFFPSDGQTNLPQNCFIVLRPKDNKQKTHTQKILYLFLYYPAPLISQGIICSGSGD